MSNILKYKVLEIKAGLPDSGFNGYNKYGYMYCITHSQ